MPNKSSFEMLVPPNSADVPASNCDSFPGEVAPCISILLSSSWVRPNVSTDMFNTSFDVNVPRSSGSLAMKESIGSSVSSNSSCCVFRPTIPRLLSRPLPRSNSSLELESKLVYLRALRLAARCGRFRGLTSGCWRGGAARAFPGTTARVVSLHK